MDAPATIADLFRRHLGDERVALRFEDASWTHREVLDAVAARAAFLLDRKPAHDPFHVGVLLDNTPEFWFALGACAVTGATLVGINPTRRGAELARDVQHTDCMLVLTEETHLPLLRDAGDVVPAERLHVVDGPEWDDALGPYAGSALPDAPVSPADRFMLIFTSGTTGAPKAVSMSQGRLSTWGWHLATNFGLGPNDTCYSVMPLFHSNAAGRGVHQHRRVGCGCRVAQTFLGERVARRRSQVRRDVLQLRRQAAHVHPRHARTTGRHRESLELRVRQRGGACSTSIASRAASAAWSSTGTARPRAAST